MDLKLPFLTKLNNKGMNMLHLSAAQVYTFYQSMMKRNSREGWKRLQWTTALLEDQVSYSKTVASQTSDILTNLNNWETNLNLNLNNKLESFPSPSFWKLWVFFKTFSNQVILRIHSSSE